ncbi:MULTISPECIES: hypothetical protein [unclassified Streptomyces]|uniref:hypothetical protein n=1 Tax=unclassified Streptomyces TaxID=2593676 RepID=UPI000DC77C14|nr:MULTISPECIES: hypothetical protein [unclassified Streptomyces]AWZ09286.1 hypothetical protein DRB89_37790 [Streptomyces sp. ICC4]AWZ15947.1 hypothetical protein DRB96_31015 [Streptomyces sp. ICC1]
MATTGEQIRAQITRLKAISGTDELKGKYVEELKKGSGKLKGKLEKSAGRYEKVSAKLGEWAGCLEHAQSETAAALTSAKEAQDSFRSLVGNEDPDSAAAKTAEKDLEPSKKTELEGARTKLEGARKRNGLAVEGYRRDSKRIADKIRDIVDDAVEDGWWSNRANWIERNLKAIKILLEVLGWIATILAIVALIIMVVALPGIGALAAIAALGQLASIAATAGTVIMLVTAGAHVAMAATGNGGWGDVAYDCVGLVTFGAGRVAAKGIQKGVAASRKASVDAGRSQTKAARQSADYTRRMRALEAEKRAAPTKAAREAIQKRQDKLKKSVKAPGVAMDAPTSTMGQTFKAGGDPAAAHAKNFAIHEATKRGGDQATDIAAKSVARNSSLGFNAFAAGTVVDWTDKAIAPSDIWEGKPRVEPYGDFKDGILWGTGMSDAMQ